MFGSDGVALALPPVPMYDGNEPSGSRHMLQCKECEFCEVGPDGEVKLNCNPFTNVKESECLLKWQLLRLDMMTRAYMATIAEYRKIAPLQQELYRRMKQEFKEMDDADSWKQSDDETDDEDEPDLGGLPPLDDRI